VEVYAIALVVSYSCPNRSLAECCFTHALKHALTHATVDSALLVGCARMCAGLGALIVGDSDSCGGLDCRRAAGGCPCQCIVAE
jgi:hypothetical protein